MSTVPPLVLGSTSVYRRALLERLGLPFTAVRPLCDEESLKDPDLDPQALAELLAAAKAESLQATHPDAVIIGSDQVCALDREVLHKAGTVERAVEQLLRLSGRDHRLITAVCVLYGERRWCFTDITTLSMRNLDRAALQRYVAADQPLDCAGTYKLECRGISLFEQIDSTDHSAIIGLPLMHLTKVLVEIGYAIP